MKMMFYQSYTTIKTNFKNLPNEINNVREIVSENARKEHMEPSIEVESVEKVGFNKYFVILRVTGRFEEI